MGWPLGRTPTLWITILGPHLGNKLQPYVFFREKVVIVAQVSEILEPLANVIARHGSSCQRKCQSSSFWPATFWGTPKDFDLLEHERPGNCQPKKTVAESHSTISFSVLQPLWDHFAQWSFFSICRLHKMSARKLLPSFPRRTPLIPPQLLEVSSSLFIFAATNSPLFHTRLHSSKCLQDGDNLARLALLLCCTAFLHLHCHRSHSHLPRHLSYVEYGNAYQNGSWTRRSLWSVC